MNPMRKYAIAMIALLALSFAAAGCGQRTEEETTATPPADNMMTPDTTMMDTTMADTTMSH